MFYVKTHLDKDTTIAVNITTENVFTRCEHCGKEIPVDLEDFFVECEAPVLDGKSFCSKDCCCAYHRKADLDFVCEAEDDIDPFGDDDDE